MPLMSSSRSAPATRQAPSPMNRKSSGGVNQKTKPKEAAMAVAPLPDSHKDNGNGEARAPVAVDDRVGGSVSITPPAGDSASSIIPATALYKLHHKRSHLTQTHQLQMLDDMDRKARELCDDTRRQYEMLLQRQDASHERQLQALHHKLKDVLSSSVTLSEHRHALSELAHAHERDTHALIKVHDDEIAQLHRRCKQIANEQQVSRSRAFQEEKDFLLDKMSQLEMDRNGALRQWREEELVVLGLRAEVDEIAQAKQVAEAKLQEACQYIVALKAQLPKIDRLRTKVKAERESHASALAQFQQRTTEAIDAKSELTTRVSVLETELKHWRSVYTSHESELTECRTALVARDALVAELQRRVAELTTKETLLREFRDGERASHDAERNEWHASLEKLKIEESDARRLVSALQLEKQAVDAQYQVLTMDVARVADERERREQALVGKLRVLQGKYAAAKKQVARLEAQQAELQDEERVNQVLFAGRR